MTERDTLFSAAVDDIAGFRFDANVVKVFPDMIKRSVPGYQTIIAMTGTLAERYVLPNSRCYDLGCSLGASTIAMRHGINADGCSIVAIDNSPEMVARCEAIIAADARASIRPASDRQEPSVQVICNDVLDAEISQASMVVMNFTLQFIAPELREDLIQRIYQGLQPGGIFILSEKIAFADKQLNTLMIDLHHAFKRANEYSELEISQKRTALEDVLLPETLETHRHRLQNVGFSNIDVWFQCFNFASLLAIK
ncbi:MAG: carboxy-S-adenosyl-L-methionine synthase CmoA [Gammaproteobacteria bacterium]|nr:MAG: carboxy-S-adenosyl-L-methionine synthase CmoA [Gammaproteobacteria bacterium]RLA52775.1 MAG: carboxy-S-adenosyl-L-methionine synthase CmoA [Gammaproteobacteria bacterium]